MSDRLTEANRAIYESRHPKEDRRPRRGGWAPGKYMNECRKCHAIFIGDKRAIDCADCAYALTE